MNASIIGLFVTSFGAIIMLGSFYGTTKKRLSRIEQELDKADEYKTTIIDKLARIETKLDYITKNK